MNHSSIQLSGRNLRDPVSIIGTLIARMSLRECAFLDELWSKRHPSHEPALTKRRHRQFLNELLGYYSCVCDDFLDGELPDFTERFMDLVTHETVRCAIHDPFLARPPYFQADLIEVRRKRYIEGICSKRSKLTLIPPNFKAEWSAARTALELRRLLHSSAADLNELSRLETNLFERLQWTARELTGR